jgi:hypothetical protein
MDVDNKRENKRKQPPCRDPPHVKKRKLGENIRVQKSREQKNREDDDCCIL